MSLRHLTDDELSAFLDGEAEQQGLIGKHIDECAACRDRFETMRRLSLALRRLSVPELRPDFAKRVIVQVRPSGRARIMPFRRYVYSAVALAASFLMLFSAWLATRDNGPSVPDRPSLASAGKPAPEDVRVPAFEDRIEDVANGDMWSLEILSAIEEEDTDTGEELVMSLADAGCFDAFDTDPEENDDLDAALAQMDDAERQAFTELLSEYQRGELTL